MENINSKVFITGATGGIGNAITELFFKNNYKLVLTSSSDDKLKNLQNKFGKDNYYYVLDLSNTQKVEETLKQISNEHKDISIIINNAAITDDGLAIRMKYNQWSKVIETNLSSNFIIIKSLLKNMIFNKKGKIVGISSVVSILGNPGQSNYVASKSGMIGLYKSIAHEVARKNINVNIVSPGFITSPMTDKLNEVQKSNIMNSIPMKKFGEPNDVASLVYYLCSDNASYITGQNFHVNGGMLMV